MMLALDSSIVRSEQQVWKSVDLSWVHSIQRTAHQANTLSGRVVMLSVQTHAPGLLLL